MSRDEASGIARTAERKRRWRRFRAPMKVVVPTAAALGAGAAVAVGQIPGSNGVIHGCYATADANGGQLKAGYGALRVIDPSQQGQDVPTDEYQCTPEEAAISWNQRGPEGPRGPVGASGAKGATGANGATGSISLIGNTNFQISGSRHDELFLKLDGIKGESQDHGHKGEIEVESFAFGSERPLVTTSAPDAGSGKVTISTFSIVKKLDKSSPQLQRDLALGTVIRGGQVDIVHASAKDDTQVASYKLSDLAIKSISIKGENETVLGSFKALQITLGSGNSSVSAKWNKIQNTGSWNLVSNKQN